MIGEACQPRLKVKNIFHPFMLLGGFTEGHDEKANGGSDNSIPEEF